MGRRDQDLLRLLANPTNRRILSLLAIEPQYPRRLAKLAGLTEDETSRRLRQFEEVGLAEGEWAYVGKNVKLYRLVASRFTIDVDGRGLSVMGLEAPEPQNLGPVGETWPSVDRFVGRGEELHALDRLLEGGSAVCVHGMAGVGKTALAAAYAARVDRPVVWHTVAAEESGILLLGRLAAGQSVHEEGEGAERLVSLRDPEDETPLLRAFLGSVDARRSLLVVDRLEVAAADAVEMIGRVVRGLTDGRLLVTARAFPPPLRRDAVASLRLEGLPREEARQLLFQLGFQPADDTLRRIHKRTLGHPLALVLVAQIASRFRTADADDLLEESGIGDFLLEEVMPQLPAAERDLLFVISVFRGPFQAEEAEAVGDARYTRNVLFRLARRGLVMQVGDRWAVHDLVRSYADRAAPERPRLHLRAARVMEASGEARKILEAAHHYLQAGTADRAAAIVWQEARHRRYRFVDGGLSGPYRDVLRRLSEAPGLPTHYRTAVALEAAALCAVQGKVAEAQSHLETARETRDGGEFEVLRLLVEARLLHVEGDLERASEGFRVAAQTAEAEGDKERLLEILLEWGFLEEERSEASALSCYLQGLELADRTADVRMLSLAYAGAARIASHLGDERFLGWAHEALRLARMAGFLRGEASAYGTLMAFEFTTGRSALTPGDADRFLEVARLLGDPWLEACARNDRALLSLKTEAYDRALVEAEACLSLARAINSPFFEFASHVCKAEALAGQGREDEALEILESAFETDLKSDSWPGFVARGWRTLAALQRSAGRPQEAERSERTARQLEERQRRAVDLDAVPPPEGDASREIP
jgi:ATP/maltotriose-dependent transcriptional regulator MalT